VPRYLLEAYVADTASAQTDAVARAKRVASLGSGIRHVRTTFVPDDQVVQHVFEAPSAGVLDRAGRRAALRYERILEAFEESGTPAPSTSAASRPDWEEAT
jgi:predicted SPOUT superfamily RNA methylase MTH1